MKGALKLVTHPEFSLDTEANGIELTVDQPAFYCIRVVGHLDRSWSNRLSGMQISVSNPVGSHEVSTLSGALADQAALFGVLKALYDMRFPLLSVECLEVS